MTLPAPEQNSLDIQYADPKTRRRTVLVAVVNNVADLQRAASHGWYRIPQRRAPRRIGADYLAFYQTGAFQAAEEAQTVTYYAPTRRYQLVTRGELLPEEQDHPRANDYYFRIEIGPLQRLERPIPAESFRRVTFIHTTFEHLLMAERVTDLFRKADPFERLWQSLREHNLRPLKNRLLGDQPMDITLRARGGYLGIDCPETIRTQERRHLPLADRWEFLSLPTSVIEQDLNHCLRQIGATLISLGGSVLNLPPTVE